MSLEPAPPRPSPNAAPHGRYPCNDGSCVISAETDEQWQHLCVAIGHPEVMADSRFETAEARVRNEDLIHPHIEEWTREHETAYVVEAMGKAGVSARVGLS